MTRTPQDECRAYFERCYIFSDAYEKERAYKIFANGWQQSRTTDNAAVEKVARAICISAGHGDPDLEMEGEPLWDEFTDCAGAAIAAMNMGEASKEGVCTASPKVQTSPTPQDVAALVTVAWHAVAALNEIDEGQLGYAGYDDVTWPIRDELRDAIINALKKFEGA